MRRALVVLLSLMAAPAFAATALDTTCNNVAHDSGTTSACNITVASNGNRTLVAFYLTNQALQTVSGMAGGGGGTWATCTVGGTATNVAYHAEAWYSIAPATGAQTVTATMSIPLTATTDGTLIVFSLYNTDQVAPCIGYASDTDDDVSVTTTVNDMALAAQISSGNATVGGCAGSNDVATSWNVFEKATHCTGSSSVTFTWSGTSAGVMNGVNVVGSALPSRALMGVGR